MRTDSAPARVRSLATWLINQMSVAGQRVVADRLAQAGAHRYDYSLLAALDEFGPMSQAELGRRCGLDRSDVAAAVGELAERGLIARSEDPTDRRRNVVRVTETGQDHLRTLDELIAEAQAAFLAPLDMVERRQLIALLTRLVDAAATS